ncbi:MAG: hypothetical protein EBU90_16040 [Proteobacteria bacterium]|nr:hypothetical protein [Pseudomonadota bacterium]
MNTNQNKGKELLGVTLTNTEAHGVICAALFDDYNTVSLGIHDGILMDLCYGDRDKALREAIIRLANRKIVTENMDMGQIHYDEYGNSFEMATDDDDLPGGPTSDNPIGYAMAAPCTEADFWDGDETDKIQY